MTETAPQLELGSTRCAICGTLDNSTEVFPANFDLDAFNATIFSARRLPDQVHYRMVSCKRCGLVRSDPVVNSGILDELYARSAFDYGEEVGALQKTYGRYLKKLEKYGVKKNAILEIGCGNGFFLEEALRQNYQTVRGVEPGHEACEKAAPNIKEYLVCDMMRAELFEAESFDVVCLFQVFDHIPDPNQMLEACFQILKPGGLILILNHNIEAVSARLLGEKSPIVDLEHTYLYSPKTLRAIAVKHGFKTRKCASVINIYSIRYLFHLVPLPKSLKIKILAKLEKSAFGQIQLLVPLGNLYLIAQKPREAR